MEVSIVFLRRTESRTRQSLGLDKIETLQEHANRDIYQQSYEIIEKFFSNETVSRRRRRGSDGRHETFQDDQEELLPTNPTSTLFNPSGQFTFGSNNSNQTVPEHNPSSLDENNVRFQF